jgi:hypothetical protein
MLDAIRTLTEVPESDDVYLSGEDIAAERRRRVLQQQARRWARDCVDQARYDAEMIHAHAFREGYAEGILRATGHLAAGLQESQALGLQLRKNLVQAARDLLAQVLSRPEWLDEMLERWLAEQSGDCSAVLQVMLPTQYQPQANAMRERWRRLWPGELVLDFHPQERCVARLADQLLEFDIEATRQRLEPRLLACIAKLPESVRSLDHTSMQALTDLCSTFAGRSAGSTQRVPGEACDED